MLSINLKTSIEEKLQEKYGEPVKVSGSRPLSGGSINEAYHLSTSMGHFFMKHNKADRYPQMFDSEARGLDLLHSTKEIRVPGVVSTGNAGNDAFIILEYIDSVAASSGFWERFGTALARLHKHFGEAFGLDHDNYIGSLHQQNRKHDKWISFFIEERLEIQLRLAINSGLIDRSVIFSFEALYKRLDEIIPAEPPSLIHGDLWSGNYMVDEKGEACIIDPAVYYGHREMDIGMSRLFGSFGGGFYESYNREYPMESGWQKRLDICNLYPLMVHVNLFGAGYVGSVKSILRQF
jgi:fructosamine-3-kinase